MDNYNIKMLIMKESVLSLKVKTSQHWCFYGQIASKY